LKSFNVLQIAKQILCPSVVMAMVASLASATDLYVDEGGTIHRLNSMGTDLGLFVPSSGHGSFAFDKNGNLFRSNFMGNGNNVQEYGPTGQLIADFSSNQLSIPSDLVLRLS
jgi:hypothetical protein